MPIELGFILQRLAAMAEQDPALRQRQPWKAAYDRDYHWLGEVMTKHYAGDDSELKVVLGGVLQAFAGMDVEAYQVAAHGFLHQGRHPTLDRHFFQCGYKPMVELLGYLTANGFTCYIASGGDRDFMRPVAERVYGIPAERVIGTSNALRYEPDEHGGTIVYLAEPDYFNDGPTKPLRIWSRIGRWRRPGPGLDGGERRARLGHRLRRRHGVHAKGGFVTTSPYPRQGGDDGADRRIIVNAGRLWTGGLATAVVAALVAVVGVLFARGLFDVPVLAPTEEGTLGDASTAQLAGLAALAALAATGLMHLLLLSTPGPWRFFAWIVALLTVVGVLLPFTTDAELDTKIATAVINLVIGLAIGTLVPAVARSATRIVAG